MRHEYTTLVYDLFCKPACCSGHLAAATADRVRVLTESLGASLPRGQTASWDTTSTSFCSVAFAGFRMRWAGLSLSKGA